jgi:adenine-specific DNA methylase
MRRTVHQVLTTPRTWPARYRLHKYWSRKPPDLVAARIAAATAPGDLVLDPFCGSGVAPIEAAALGRRAIGVDVNPFAIFLARTTAVPCLPDALAAAGARVLEAAAAAEGDWHRTPCRRCGADAALAGTARRGAEIVAVHVRCPRCGGTRREEPLRSDIRLAIRARAAGDGDAPRPPVFAGWQTRKLVRAGLSDFGELFTTRNLRALATIRAAIITEPDDAIRDCLLLALTGALAQGSRMMADHGRDGGGASWKLNIYWLPERSLELDPFRCFANRLQRVVAAKRETAQLLAGAEPPRFVCADARRLAAHVPDGSAAYAFADPPYGGEGIQYAELSALWCAWLDPPLTPAHDDEIGENPHRGRDRVAFATGLLDGFRAVHRALAPGGRMTVTFASRDPRSWQALDAALAGAGFRVDEQTALGRSAPGLTERTSPGATRADAWLECVRLAR